MYKLLHKVALKITQRDTKNKRKLCESLRKFSVNLSEKTNKNNDKKRPFLKSPKQRNR